MHVGVKQVELSIFCDLFWPRGSTIVCSLSKEPLGTTAGIEQHVILEMTGSQDERGRVLSN